MARRMSSRRVGRSEEDGHFEFIVTGSAGGLLAVVDVKISVDDEGG